MFRLSAPSCDMSSLRLRTWKREQYVGHMSLPCFYCGVHMTRQDATVDHVIPIARGGPDVANNYALACSPCNSDKGDRLPSPMFFEDA